MDTEGRLRSLRTSAIVVTAFALLLACSGLVQIALDGIAVSEEYERIERAEEVARQSATFYGYRSQQSALQGEYNRSSTAFFLEGRFMPSSGELAWGDPAVIAALVLVLSGFGFLIAAMFWVWRAHANLAEAGVRAKFGPRKAVAAYLIPAANLILPFEAMRELYNRSHGEIEEFAHSTVEDVTAWWTSVVVGLLIFSAMIVKFMLDAGTSLIIMTPIWMEFTIIAFALILLLGAAYLFSGLARKITAAQHDYLPDIAESLPDQETPRRMSVSIISTTAASG